MPLNYQERLYYSTSEKRRNYQATSFTPGNTSGNLSECTCQGLANKIAINSNPQFNNQMQTKTQRMVNDVRYSRGGNIVFGNTNNVGISFLGKLEGQLGGLPRPIRNKF
jgi:hypothetical protein